MASPVSLNKPGLNNFNDLSNKIPGEPLPGQIMEISTVIIGPPGRIMEISTVIIRPMGRIMTVLISIIRPGRGSPGNLGNGGKFKLGTLPAMFSSLIGLAK